MNKNRILILLFYVLLISDVYSQTWLRIYYDSNIINPKKIYESYDKGYVLAGYCYSNPQHYYGWLMKTDVNGYKRWTKYFGDPFSFSAFSSSKVTSDGGMVLIGDTYEYLNKDNPLIVKINSCGEKEWCRIYKSSNPLAGGIDIVEIQGGGFIALFRNWIYQMEQNIWLFRLDSLGNIIWQQNYVADPNIFYSPDARNLIRTSDSRFIITGWAYSPDSLYPGYKILKIFHVKVTVDGVSLFQVPWGNNNGIISDEGHSCVEDVNHNLLTPGRRARNAIPYGDSPCLYKSWSTGIPMLFHDLNTGSDGGGGTTINWFQDSTLAISSMWSTFNGVDTLAVIKTDQTGNILKTKPIVFNDPIGALWGSDITFNNRVIVTGTLSAGACSVKLTSNLEYDSIYTQPFTYDSLCPHQIVTDTVPLNDCSVVTNIFNPSRDKEKIKLHIYPNPAKNTITIEMPQYITRQSSGYGVTATTYYHQWNTTTLEIYDLFGKLMYSKEISKKTEKVELNVSSWHAGMYLARVVFMNEVVAGAKFVVE